MKRPEKLYLVDGNSYIYRAYHAIKGLRSSKGFPTNAIYGFTNTLLKILRERRPDAIAVSFDSPLPTKRHRVYEEYKAQRPETPDDLTLQMPHIRRVIDALRIKTYEIPGYEADDVIATLAVKAASQGLDVYIVTGDKDMLQVLDGRVRIYDPVNNRIVGREYVVERFGVPPERIPEIMALTGDSIDNIPGVKGIGEKTASELLKANTLEEILRKPALIEKERIRRLIEENRGSILMSLDLSRVDTGVPLELDIEECRLREPDWEELLDIFREFEFTTLVKMIPAARVTGRYETVLDLERLRELLLQVKGSLAIDIIPSGVHRGAGPTGIAFSFEKVTGYYIPLGHHYLGAPKQLDAEAVFQVLKPHLEDGSIDKAGHDMKAHILRLRKAAVDLEGRLYDTMVASYLLNPNRSNHSLEETCLEHLSLRKKAFKEVMANRASFAEVDVEEAAEYAGTNTAVVLKLKEILFRKLGEDGLEPVYFEIEMPLIRVLAEMEEIGIKVDVSLLDELSKELERELSSLKERIYRLAGREFNINSPKQLSTVLFQTLGLKPSKRTKTGYSTEVGVLEELAREHELPREILNWRMLSKLKSTYVDVLPRLIDPETGRLHTTFNQTVTATGRLSSSDPNLQNIPVRGEWGERIRRAFVAEEGFHFLSADYSQIELRILAHLSKDEGLIDAFTRDLDIHTRTAAELFGVSEDAVTPEMRRVAKTVNFGVIYGISAFGLSEALGIPREDAGLYIEQYFEKHPGVRRYMEQTVEEASRLGHVRTLFGRKREIPELKAGNSQRRALGERLAMNTPVQGSAADIIKMAMIGIHREIKARGLKSRMLLQVHDELVFEVAEDELATAGELIKRQMEGAASLEVPIRVEMGYGKNWAEAHR